MVRSILAVIGGLFAGGIAVMLVESINLLWHTIPAGFDFQDKAAVAEWIQSLPWSALAVVVVAWGIGGLVCTLVARRVAARRASRPALVAAFVFLAAVGFNLYSLPHPFWMWPVGIGLALGGCLLGYLFAAPGSYLLTERIRIRAPVNRVFQTLARAEEFTRAVPEIARIEFLSESQYGVGTRFRETRTVQGRTASVDLEICEQLEDQLLRLESQVAGAKWRTLFSLHPQGPEVELRMALEAIPNSLLARLLMPQLLFFVGAGIRTDLECVRDYCEENPT